MVLLNHHMVLLNHLISLQVVFMLLLYPYARLKDCMMDVSSNFVHLPRESIKIKVEFIIANVLHLAFESLQIEIAYAN